MNVSANDILTAFTGNTIPTCVDFITGKITVGRVKDPKSLQADQFPHAFIAGLTTDVEVLDWRQRRTIFAFDCYVCFNAETLANVVTFVENFEDRAQVDFTLQDTVDFWNVISWDVFDLDPDDIYVAALRISTTRVEP